ncbi:MAG: hypothetical protein ACRDN9_21480, partial [Streptosporangiaceae bacterium]
MTLLALVAGHVLTAGPAEPGLLAFGIVACLGVILYFLIRSMNKQFKKVNFEEKPQGSRAERPRAEEPEAPKASEGPQGRSGVSGVSEPKPGGPRGRRPRGSQASSERRDPTRPDDLGHPPG